MTTLAPHRTTPPMLAPYADWEVLVAQAQTAVPEAFGDDGSPRNLLAAGLSMPVLRRAVRSPVDGRELGTAPFVDGRGALDAVAAAAREADRWSRLSLDERSQRVAACLSELERNRELLALLLVWEIGTPARQARTEVARMLDGVAWYVDVIEPMLAGRRPIGLVSNIASWNYPLSVLAHSALVQSLVGNGAIAKTPTDGGLFALTVAFSIARRHGLPLSLVSGPGAQLSRALVDSQHVSALAFVGGKPNGREVAATLRGRSTRLMLEMEGVNAYGLWEFSDWDRFSAHVRKSYEYGKQRCTAYTRFVVQRRLFPAFLDSYLNALHGLSVGHPLLVEHSDDPLPDVDFGPLINRAAVDRLRVLQGEALASGAIALHRARLDESRLIPGQDDSAYIGPVALLGVPRSASLYHSEPFGPIDTIVVVDRPEELVAEMNVSNGALVATIASDDLEAAQEIKRQLRAFKVGINELRSRGDRDEPFGGLGESWKGCFVGGHHLVNALSIGPPGERLAGNFEDGTRLPPTG